MEGNLKTKFHFSNKRWHFPILQAKRFFSDLCFLRADPEFYCRRRSLCIKMDFFFYSIELMSGRKLSPFGWIFYTKFTRKTGTQVHCTNCKRNNYLEVSVLLLLPPCDCVEDFFVVGADGRVVVVLVRVFVRCGRGDKGLLVVDWDVRVVGRCRRGRGVDVGVEWFLFEMRLVALHVMIWCVRHLAGCIGRVGWCRRQGSFWSWKLRTFAVVRTRWRAGTCWVIFVIVEHILEAADVFDCHLQSIDFAQFLCRSTSTFGKCRHDRLRDMLAQVGKSIVHLLHAISFAGISSGHGSGLIWLIRLHGVVVFFLRDVDHLISAVRCENCRCRRKWPFAMRREHLLRFSAKHVGRDENTIVGHVRHHVNILTECHCANWCHKVYFNFFKSLAFWLKIFLRHFLSTSCRVRFQSKTESIREVTKIRTKHFKNFLCLLSTCPRDDSCARERLNPRLHWVTIASEMISFVLEPFVLVLGAISTCSGSCYVALCYAFVRPLYALVLCVLPPLTAFASYQLLPPFATKQQENLNLLPSRPEVRRFENVIAEDACQCKTCEAWNQKKRKNRHQHSSASKRLQQEMQTVKRVFEP